jgi:hypothetical protein
MSYCASLVNCLSCSECDSITFCRSLYEHDHINLDIDVTPGVRVHVKWKMLISCVLAVHIVGYASAYYWLTNAVQLVNFDFTDTPIPTCAYIV